MKFYYFNSTHWDREWYEPFQKFRRHLVDTTGVLLNALEQGVLEKFTFDGQTVVLEDVTEVHPAWRERLSRQIAAGRLKVGPWYVQPDEFLPSFEALIRNLQFGREVAREFGAGRTWPVGYLCDMFGHIAQMPQLLAGFGIAEAVMWRGVDSEFPPHFLWRSPDGSACRVIRLHPRFGYAEFSIYVLGLWKDGVGEEEFKAAFTKYVADVEPYFGEHILLCDALDHIMPRVELETIFRWIRELFPESEVIHSDLTDFREASGGPLPVFDGELIRTADTGSHNGMLLTNCLSARYDIKYANDRLQNELELLSGPVQAMAALGGCERSYPYWKMAWKRLVANHAHDSVCGCAVDAVHRRMLADFDEIGRITELFREDLIYGDRERCTGKPVAEEANDCERRNVRVSEEPDSEGCYMVRIFNPLPWERDEVVDFEIAFPSVAAYPAKCGELNLLKPFNCFRLCGEDGSELRYSLNEMRNSQVRRFYRHDSREYDVYAVSARLRLRSCGWTTVRVVPSKMPVRFLSHMMASPCSAENEFLRLDVHGDGTFDVTDKRSERKFAGLNNYLLDREIGDGWLSAKGPGTLETVAASFGQVAIAEKSPFRTTFVLTRRYEVARKLDYRGTLNFRFDRVAESGESVMLEVKTFVSLEEGSDVLKVRTVIDNTVSDCRLRLVVPTGIAGDWFAYQNGAFLNRPVGRRSGEASASYQEAEPLEKNFSGIAGKRDGRGGLALLSCCGLHEVAADATSGGELCFTMFRAFGRTVRDNGGENGQLQKTLEFEYGYAFFTPECTAGGLFNDMQELRMRPVFHTVAAEKFRVREEPGFLKVSGDVGFLTFSPAFSDSRCAVLRLANFSGEPERCRIALSGKFEIFECRFDETREKACGGEEITISSGQVSTFLIRRDIV